MEEEINEEVICVLRKNKLTNQIEIDYVEIEQQFAEIIDNFSALCNNSNSTLSQIINFIKTTIQLNQLSAHYRYCVHLNGSYQTFKANNEEIISEIHKRHQLMLMNQKNEPKKYDIKKAITNYKVELKSKYILWSKAYSINKTYRLCHEDNSLLTFSHRIDGYSNPVYQLTANFSIEIKTNFGYGRSSYFFTKLKYKKIEITPFSHWINYEFAKFSEIIRYTQIHSLRNDSWLEAMEFTKDACNLSLTNEVKFVEKYIIDECEKMVSGLENIFNEEQYSFKDKDYLSNTKNEKKPYTVSKKGHDLVEFRGEKVSGALDFISKILEFEKVASIKNFIKRIETCNKRIQPILFNESKILNIKILNLTEELNYLKPKYDKVHEDNNNFSKKKYELQRLMVRNGQLDELNINTEKLNIEFHNKFPNYKEFQIEYKKVTETFRILTEQIKNFTKVFDNIVSYNEKIVSHFTNLSSGTLAHLRKQKS